MQTTGIPLVIGNWKMNPLTESAAVTLAKEVLTISKKAKHARVVVVPPALYIPAVSKVARTTVLGLGVQHVVPGPVGAVTGEISGAMAQPYGITYAIVGHSEQRALGVTDEQVAATVAMLIKIGITPVICVGERERDSRADFYSLIASQIKTALAAIPKTKYKQIVIAYEPIWAIGTGKTATPADVQEMRLFINKVITDLAGRPAAKAVTVLYGGSVTKDNALSLWQEGQVDGFLVGGASLKGEDFATIIASTK